MASELCRILGTFGVSVTALCCIGCSYPIQKGVPPAQAAELEGPRIVGAIKKDGREVQFDDSSDGGSAASTLKGDTLVAHVNGTMVSIPTQEVDEVLIEEVYHDKMATYFWLGAGAAAVAWSVWFVLTWGPGN